MRITYVTSPDRMDEIHREFDSAIEREAAKRIQSMPLLHELYESVQDFEVAFKERVRQLAEEAGVELDREGW